MTIPSRSAAETSTCAQLAALLQAVPGAELGTAIRAIESFLPGMRGRIVLSMGGYGVEASPLALGTRTEWSELLRSSKCFYGTFTSPAVAAQFSQFQLFNLAGSGKILLASFASAEPLAAMEVILTADTVQAAAAVGPGSNLLLGGVAAVGGSIRISSAAAIAGTVMYASQNGANNSVFNPNLNGFVVEIPEGRGLSWWGNVVNQGIKGTFMWAEVDTTYPR